LTNAEIGEDETYARKAVGIAKVTEMEAVEVARAVAASSQSIPSTLDLESFGDFDPSTFAAPPADWMYARSVSAE
jgi:hypothetical protein